MNIDWTTVIATILPLLLSMGLIEGIMYRKQNKRLKDLEVAKSKQDIKQDNIDLQQKEIDLGAQFMQQSMEMMKKVQDTVIGGNKDVRSDLGQINDKLSDVVERVSNIEEYLNGDFKKFMKNKSAKSKDTTK